MRAWLVLLTGLALSGPLLGAEGGPNRFSQAVPNEQRAATGLSRLSSDQLGALDALVRRDIVQSKASDTETVRPPFSDRLTSDERRAAGLDSLSAEELAQLNVAVERHATAALARTLLAPPVYISRSSRIEPREKKAAPEVHGSFTLSYGWGKDGYSEKSGSMVVTVEDPSRRFGLAIGYSRTEIKGDDLRYIEASRP